MRLMSAVASPGGSSARVSRIVFVPPRAAGPGRAEANYAGYTFTTAGTWIQNDPADAKTAPSLIGEAAAAALPLHYGSEVNSLEDEYDALGSHSAEGRYRKDCVIVEEVQGQTAPEYGGIGTDRDERVNLRFSIRMDGGGNNAGSRARLKSVRDWLIEADHLDLGTGV